MNRPGVTEQARQNESAPDSQGFKPPITHEAQLRQLRQLLEDARRDGCADCGQPFMFLGLGDDVGYRQERPSVDVARRELSAPIAPWDGSIATHAEYEMPDGEVRS